MATISKPKQNRIKQLADQGHSKAVIAKLTGCGRPTIDKYVMFDEVRHGPLNTLKSNMSTLLHELLGNAMSLHHKLLNSMLGEDILTLPFSDRRQLLRDNSVVVGTLYDKIRLQDGKSTSNNSHEIQLKQVHKDMTWDATSSGK